MTFASHDGMQSADAAAVSPQCNTAVCRTAPHLAVSELSDDELEAHITSLGKLIERAMKLGNRDEALGLQRCMYDTIAARSPARQAAMEAQIQRRIEEGQCYFTSDAANALGRVGAAG